jgi:hypothetical protein
MNPGGVPVYDRAGGHVLRNDGAHTYYRACAYDERTSGRSVSNDGMRPHGDAIPDPDIAAAGGARSNRDKIPDRAVVRDESKGIRMEMRANFSASFDHDLMRNDSAACDFSPFRDNRRIRTQRSRRMPGVPTGDAPPYVGLRYTDHKFGNADIHKLGDRIAKELPDLIICKENLMTLVGQRGDGINHLDRETARPEDGNSRHRVNLSPPRLSAKQEVGKE